MDQHFSERVETLKKNFKTLSSAEERYAHIIELGRSLPSYPNALKVEEKRVPGCQSVLYLSSFVEKGKLIFRAECDALISLGLAALLISVYSGLEPKEIVLNPPLFLKELGIFSSLSPNRSNGLVNIYHRMKIDALKELSLN